MTAYAWRRTVATVILVVLSVVSESSAATADQVSSLQTTRAERTSAAGTGQQTVMFLVNTSGSRAGTKLQQAQQALTARPALEDVDLTELSEKEMEFLAADCGAGIGPLSLLATASGLAAETQLPATLFYALGRERLPLDLDALRGLPPKVIRDALDRAVAEEITPAIVDCVDLDQALGLVERWLAGGSWGDKADGSGAS